MSSAAHSHPWLTVQCAHVRVCGRVRLLPAAKTSRTVRPVRVAQGAFGAMKGVFRLRWWSRMSACACRMMPTRCHVGGYLDSQPTLRRVSRGARACPLLLFCTKYAEIVLGVAMQEVQGVVHFDDFEAPKPDAGKLTEASTITAGGEIPTAGWWPWWLNGGQSEVKLPQLVPTSRVMCQHLCPNCVPLVRVFRRLPQTFMFRAVPRLPDGAGRSSSSLDPG